MIRLVAAVMVMGLAGIAAASAPVGVFAIVDQVVVEPEEGPVERVQIWGGFALVNPDRRWLYLEPVWGYLYLSVSGDAEQDRLRRNEWKDLQRKAGSGEVVAFGSSRGKSPRVRSTSEPPSEPDLHPLGVGVIVTTEFHRRGAITSVLHSAKPQGPVDGAEVEGRSVELSARNSPASQLEEVTYHFEIQGPDGLIQVSPPIPPGKETTTWTPGLPLEPGETYTWRVWISGDSIRHAVRRHCAKAESHFTVAGQPRPGSAPEPPGSGG